MFLLSQIYVQISISSDLQQRFLLILFLIKPYETIRTQLTTPPIGITPFRNRTGAIPTAKVIYPNLIIIWQITIIKQIYITPDL